MNSLDVEVLRSAIDWQGRGHRVTLGTVVRTWGSAPRPPGSLMVIRDDGQVAGSLSGGCIEDDLIGRVARGELAALLPQVTSYGASAEEAQRFGLPCGGTVQVVLEPLSARSQLRELLAAIEAHRRVARRLDMSTGVVRLADALEGDTLRFDGAQLTTVHGPRLRLLIIGGGQLSRYLAAMAVMLDYTSPSASRARSTTRAGRRWTACCSLAACPTTWCWRWRWTPTARSWRSRTTPSSTTWR